MGLTGDAKLDSTEDKTLTATSGIEPEENWAALSLSAKVALLVSLIVFVVIFALTYWINKASADAIERGLRESITRAAEEIPDQLLTNIPGHPRELPGNQEIADTLPELQTLNVNITDISVYRINDKGEPILAATTEKTTDIPLVNLIPSAMQQKKTLTNLEMAGEEHFFDVYTPIQVHQGKTKPGHVKVLGCVSLRASLKQAADISRQNLQFALKVFAPVTIALLIVLLTVLLRLMIHQPVKKIRAAMARAQAGDLEATVALNSGDELGQIAATYNRMLNQIREATLERLNLIDRINHFNVELQTQVQQATSELQDRNQQLRDLNFKLLRMQREMVQMERLAVAGQLTATFAHEVGTPLNLISGHVQLLKEAFQENESVFRKLTLIESQIRRLSEIVRRLLDATRRPKVEAASINLEVFLRDIGTLILPTLQSHQVSLALSIPPGLPSIQADPKQLEQVLLNLINNSLDAMPQGGELKLEAALPEEQMAMIRVSDTGTGIEPHNMDKLFQPMFTTKGMGSGTGLGLAICQAIIKEHGGEIEVESQLDRGTTFSIYLPAQAIVVVGSPQSVQPSLISE